MSDQSTLKFQFLSKQTSLPDIFKKIELESGSIKH